MSTYLAQNANWGHFPDRIVMGKTLVPGETSRRKDENQQQTQHTYKVESGNRAQATLVGGECSHHCAIPAPQINRYSVKQRCHHFQLFPVLSNDQPANQSWNRQKSQLSQLSNRDIFTRPCMDYSFFCYLSKPCKVHSRPASFKGSIFTGPL